MRPKGFLTLVVLAGLSAGGAFLAVQQREAATAGEFLDQKLLPGLDARLNAVQAVHIAKANETFTLVKSGEGWRAPDKSDHPARFDKVRGLLVGLAELKIAERRTKDASLHDRLDLAPTEAKDSKAIRVTLLDSGGKTIADLFVGKQRFGGGGLSAGVYARRAEDAQTWLTKGDLDVRDPAIDWLDRGIMDIAGKRVAEAVIAQPEGAPPLTLRKDDAEKEDFSILALPEGQKISSQYSVNASAGALERLVLDDVRRAEGLAFPETPAGTYKTHDGLVVTTRFAEIDGKTWLKVAASTTPEAADAVKEEAAKLNLKTAEWAYGLAEWKVNQLRRKLSELVEPEKQS